MARVEYKPCWREIGVWSARRDRCARLTEVVHCRNCDVFAAAGRQALERAAPKGYVAEGAEELARPLKKLRSGVFAVVVFRIGQEWFALPASVVHKIIDVRPIHKIPHNQTPHLLGVINFDGQLRPCLSLAGLVGVRDVAGDDVHNRPGRYPRQLVLKHGDVCVAVAAAEVAEIWRYSEADIRLTPRALARDAGRITRGILTWNDIAVAFLDVDVLMNMLGGVAHV